MTSTVTDFRLQDLPDETGNKTALLINPPVYDTQYWPQWALPYGLLRIGALLRRHGYRQVVLFDFLETSPDDRRAVPQHRIDPHAQYDERDRPASRPRPIVLEKAGERLELFKYHFGKPWETFDDWLEAQGFTAAHPPDEIWISAIMTYWWESVRDLTARLKRRFPRSTIILGGIYPTLCPEHAAQYTSADLVVVGEVKEANNLWPDLALYTTPPAYAIITPARGCPYNCAYCAQRTLNEGRQSVEYRPVEDIVAEMRYAHETYGVKDFAFYADYLPWSPCFEQLLERLAGENFYFRLYAPEGFDPRPLARSPRLAELMKKTRFQKIYLALENIDGSWLETLDRRHVQLEHFVRAVQNLEQVGFPLRNMDVNAFVLYGLPGETIDSIVKTTLFASEVVGSVIPMLFTPVPTTALYQKYLPYFQERGWDQDLHMLNGKLYPFLEVNEGTIADYIDLQRLMFALNAHYRSKSFQIFGGSRVSAAFRANLGDDFEHFLRQALEKSTDNAAVLQSRHSD